MCNDHQRSSPLALAPTITRVPLARISQPSRWSRRRLLVNAGLGTASMAIFAACGSTADNASSTTTSSTPATPTEPNAGAGESTAAPEVEEPEAAQAGTTEAEQAAPAEPEAAPSGELQLQHVNLGFVSAYVLVRGSEVAIVDTGVAGSGPAINDAITMMGLMPSDVRHIVLTHNHADHSGGLGDLEGAMTNATVHAGPGDVDSIRTSLALNEVADGDEVFGMGIVGTPGHTTGSISVFDTDTGLLVAGDAINGDGSGGLLGANPSFTEDMDAANASVARMAALSPMIAAFGHGGAPVTEDVTAKLAAIA